MLLSSLQKQALVNNIEHSKRQFFSKIRGFQSAEVSCKTTIVSLEIIFTFDMSKSRTINKNDLTNFKMLVLATEFNAIVP